MQAQGYADPHQSKNQGWELDTKFLGKFFDTAAERMNALILIACTALVCIAGTIIYRDFIDPCRTARAVDMLSNYEGTQYVQVVTDTGKMLTVQNRHRANEKLAKVGGN